MVHKSPELELPYASATQQDIDMGMDELIPGVNVPRPGTDFHLSPGTAACLRGTADRTSVTLDTPTKESDDETLSR